MKKGFYGGQTKLGILGGGQLGRMFIQEAIDFDIHISILDPSAEAPCSAIAHEFTQGNLNDFDTVVDFGKSLDLLTIEIEHVNADAMEELKKRGVIVYPDPAILRIVQDKGLQKQFYADHNLPTSPFHLIKDKADIESYRDRFPFMQKLRTGGYDGRGVTPLQTEEDMAGAFDAPSVLEEFVEFEKEISVIIARNPSGEIKTFPVVELDFNPEANLVEYLFAPAHVTEDVEQKAHDIAHRLVEALQFVGILAVEMFVTPAGEVLVNEIAPRPHNSGHHTIEANVTSQYEQHMRSVLNLPLGSTKATAAAVMVNLLGEKGHTGPVRYEGIEEVLSWEGVKPHIYGKTHTKPFRKMGHITVVGDNLEEVREVARKVKRRVRVVAL